MIRKADMEDAEILAVLAIQMWPEHDPNGLAEEFTRFKPDVVYSDSACFWGKLNAWKFNVPLA